MIEDHKEKKPDDEIEIFNDVNVSKNSQAGCINAIRDG